MFLFVCSFEDELFINLFNNLLTLTFVCSSPSVIQPLLPVSPLLTLHLPLWRTPSSPPSPSACPPY